MGWQGVGHDWVTQQQIVFTWARSTKSVPRLFPCCCCFFSWFFFFFLSLYWICHNTASVLVFWPRGRWDLSSQTRDWTTPCVGSGTPGRSLCPGFNSHTVSGDEVKLGSRLGWSQSPDPGQSQTVPFTRQSGKKTWTMGLRFNKETTEEIQGQLPWEITSGGGGGHNGSGHSQHRCPESLLESHWGLRLGQRGFCSEEAAARGGLCWRQPKGSSLTADSPLTTALNPCPRGGPGEEACSGGTV